MISLQSEDGLNEAWRRISAHTGNRELTSRIVARCPLVRLLGRGPFGRIELQQRVEPMGIQTVRWVPNEHLDATILVGEYDWTEEELIQIVLAARGGRLRLTCQQDLVYELLLVTDASANWEALRVERDAARAEHSALRWVAKHFAWKQVVNREVPSNIVAPAKQASLSAWQHARRSGWAVVPSWPNGVVPLEGVLQATGYKVGRSGLGTEDRRRALRTVIEEELPRGFHESYAAQWGAPMSTTRLWKTAETLAALARNARNRSANMDRAIEHWESDLNWLRIEYADLARTVYWPSV
jgi:hypothetical protein